MKDIHNIRANIPYISFLKYLQAIDPLIVTITTPISNKIGEALRIEMNVYTFREKWKNRFIKTCHFFKIL